MAFDRCLIKGYLLTYLLSCAPAAINLKHCGFDNAILATSSVSVFSLPVFTLLILHDFPSPFA